MSDSATETQHKIMDRRKKRTSTNQYMMYIEMMEKDPVFATGRIPRDYDSNYLTRKWKELSDKLNSCGNGPTLTSEEWRKRLNDWKNTTRCKFRRSVSGEKDVTMTSLEMRALELFGKVPATAPPEQPSIHFKSEKEEIIDDDDVEHIPNKETMQKQLQAAVDEAIGDEEADQIIDADHEEEQDDHEEILPESLHHTSTGGGSGVGGNSTGGGTTYRAIIVDDSAYHDDDNVNDDQLEFITHRRTTLNSSTGSTVQTAQVVTTQPTATVTKLINGDIPLKRLRSQAPDQIIYEVKKAPASSSRTYTVSHPHIQQHASQQHHSSSHHHHQQQQQLHHQQPTITSEIHTGSTLQTLGGQILTATPDTRDIARQLKRIADIKAEKLRFDIARFKFNNPGFNYSLNHL